MEDLIKKKNTYPTKDKTKYHLKPLSLYNVTLSPNTSTITFLKPTQEMQDLNRMIVPIPSLNEAIDLNCFMIGLNDFIEGTNEIDLAIKRGRYKRALPIEVEEISSYNWLSF